MLSLAVLWARLARLLGPLRKGKRCDSLGSDDLILIERLQLAIAASEEEIRAPADLDTEVEAVTTNPLWAMARLVRRALYLIKQSLVTDPLVWEDGMEQLHEMWSNQQALLSAGLSAASTDLDLAGLRLEKAVSTRTPKWLLQLAIVSSAFDDIMLDELPPRLALFVSLAREQNPESAAVLLDAIGTLAASVCALQCGPTASSIAPVLEFSFSMADMDHHNRKEARITIAECAFAESGLGFKTWTAANAFARAMFEQPELLIGHPRGRNCVELGCGTGLLGIAAWVAGANCVVQTDYSRTMLDTSAQNLALNRRNHTSPAGKVLQARLDWTWFSPLDVEANGDFPPVESDAERERDVVLKMCAENDVDFVIGADVVYDIEHAQMIADVAYSILSRSSSLNAKHLTVVVATEEYRRGVDLFRARCEERNFRLLSQSQLTARDRHNRKDILHHLFQFQFDPSCTL